jgi:hemoglobin/transferrin/lactoferrin receptor protein
MVDGVRMNNLIYRAGHLQNAITMDNNVLDRAEILFGPSSTVYGSDALGGVVHFYTRNPELAKEKSSLFFGSAFTRIGNVNNELTTHVDFNLSGKKLGSLTSFTYSDFGDLKMGEKTNPALDTVFGLRPYYVQRKADNSGDTLMLNSNSYVQKFSGYRQYDALQKFLIAPNEWWQHVFNLQFSTSSNIPRYDRLTDSQGTGLRSAEWYYGPQKRWLASYQLKSQNLGAIAEALSATVSYQAIEESRHDRRFNSNNLNHRTENVDVLALTVDLKKDIGSHKLRYGFDSQLNFLKSTAYRENIVNHVKDSLDTRYPNGNNSMNYWAVYVTHTQEINETWTLNDGVRFGVSSLHAELVKTSFSDFPFNKIDQKNTYVSGNLGLIFTPTSWKFSLMGSTGYRVPNIDDLAKVFESVVGSASNNGLLIVPNPDLKPEKTINGDFGVTKFFGDKVRLEGVFFATQFFDAIAVRPTTFNGQSTVTYGGFPADVMSSQNVGKAFLFGYNAQLRADFSSWALTASYNYTHGSVRNSGGSDTSLDHIPPQFGRLGIVYTHEALRTEWFCNFSGKKYLSDYSASGEDNLQYAPATGMPGWYTLNWRLSYDLATRFTVQTGVDNLLDLQYRTFASGINAPGRNLFITMRIKF